MFVHRSPLPCTGQKCVWIQVFTGHALAFCAKLRHVRQSGGWKCVSFPVMVAGVYLELNNSFSKLFSSPMYPCKSFRASQPLPITYTEGTSGGSTLQLLRVESLRAHDFMHSQTIRLFFKATFGNVWSFVSIRLNAASTFRLSLSCCPLGNLVGTIIIGWTKNAHAQSDIDK